MADKAHYQTDLKLEEVEKRLSAMAEMEVDLCRKRNWQPPWTLRNRKPEIHCKQCTIPWIRVRKTDRKGRIGKSFVRLLRGWVSRITQLKSALAGQQTERTTNRETFKRWSAAALALYQQTCETLKCLHWNWRLTKLAIDNFELVCYTTIKRGDTRWIFSWMLLRWHVLPPLLSLSLMRKRQRPRQIISGFLSFAW